MFTLRKEAHLCLFMLTVFMRAAVLMGRHALNSTFFFQSRNFDLSGLFKMN